MDAEIRRPEGRVCERQRNGEKKDGASESPKRMGKRQLSVWDVRERGERI